MHFFTVCVVFARNSSVEAYYVYLKDTDAGGYYYLNDFSHLLSAGGMFLSLAHFLWRCEYRCGEITHPGLEKFCKQLLLTKTISF